MGKYSDDDQRIATMQWLSGAMSEEEETRIKDSYRERTGKNYDDDDDED